MMEGETGDPRLVSNSMLHSWWCWFAACSKVILLPLRTPGWVTDVVPNRPLRFAEQIQPGADSLGTR